MNHSPLPWKVVIHLVDDGTRMTTIEDGDGERILECAFVNDDLPQQREELDIEMTVEAVNVMYGKG